LALPFFSISIIVAAVCVASAGARPLAAPGVTPTEIKLGSTAPLTGEGQAAGNVARGADAYFKYVNARGGVHGRRIAFKYLDDGYDPARALTNTVRLVEHDQVFAMFSPLGTDGNLAIRKFLNQLGVPQLFVGSGATTFGRDYRQYPWTIGYMPPYSEEGEIYGTYILGHVKRPRIAVLYENDQYGQDLLSGLRKGLGLRTSAIVGKVGYSPGMSDVRPQIAQLKASNANVFCIFASGKFAQQAFTGMAQLAWKPLTVVNDASAASRLMSGVPQKAANGAVSIVFGKDPASPIWKGDRGIKLFQRILKRYGGSGIDAGDLSDKNYVAGMAAAYTMVDVLQKAGPKLTRRGAMRAATHLDEHWNPFVLPGVVVRTSPTLRFPVTQVRLQRWSAGAWRPFGRLLAMRP
jgi:branched-chain amino acid transport system substrate-binding protein